MRSSNPNSWQTRLLNRSPISISPASARMRPRVGPKQRFNFRRDGDELAQCLTVSPFLPISVRRVRASIAGEVGLLIQRSSFVGVRAARMWTRMTDGMRRESYSGWPANATSVTFSHPTLSNFGTEKQTLKQ